MKPPGSSEPITVLSDSLLLFKGDNYETQLPCSPGSLATSDVALQTLKAVDEHEKTMDEQVATTQATGLQEITSIKLFCLYTFNRIIVEWCKIPGSNHC